MTLTDVIRSLADWPEELTIYAAEPWTTESLALGLMEPDAGGTPPEASAMKLSYFIEVHIASEFFSGWLRTNTWDLETATQRLIQYAIHYA